MGQPQRSSPQLPTGPTPEEIAAGQAVYSQWVLGLYDLFVLGISNHFIWKCPTRFVIDHYNRHISLNHLDVGVGTGYLLDHCTFPSAPRLTIMDLNHNCLVFSANRLKRYQPTTVNANVLAPLTEVFSPAQKFDSIGLNYVLHCLPGTMREKGVAFRYLKDLLSSKGTLFGTTVLSQDVPKTFCAKKLMEFYNKEKIFSNAHDGALALEQELSRNFQKVEVKVIGNVGLFSAQKD